MERLLTSMLSGYTVVLALSEVSPEYHNRHLPALSTTSWIDEKTTSDARWFTGPLPEEIAERVDTRWQASNGTNQSSSKPLCVERPGRMDEDQKKLNWV